MKVLIAGANGQLARELARLLKKGNGEFLAPPEEEFDVTDFKRVRTVMKEYRPDFVINCSAYNFVDRAEGEWRQACLVNGVAVKHLLLAAMDITATLVHFSTDYVFDGKKTEPYTVADSPHPINRYGMSKVLGERYLLTGGYSRYYLVRVSWVFGEGANSFVVKLMEWMEKNRTLRIVDDQVASPTYTCDLAKAVLDLIKTGDYGLYHITNGGSCSRWEWARFVAEATGFAGEVRPAKSSDFDSPAERPSYSVLDNFPLEETIGYLLPDWKDATKRFLETKGSTS